MLPESLRGFAPIVRGSPTATLRSRYARMAALSGSRMCPWPFAISDLYPTSSSGELEIVILESDGTQRRSVQPFSAVPVMQREGRFKYSVAAGNYRSSDTTGREPTFFRVREFMVSRGPRRSMAAVSFPIATSPRL
ncbi:hypothetical protein DMH27_03085 [Raoultella planticola]|nr:hypothetical protein [Raoultella planticola]